MSFIRKIASAAACVLAMTPELVAQYEIAPSPGTAGRTGSISSAVPEPAPVAPSIFSSAVIQPAAWFGHSGSHAQAMAAPSAPGPESGPPAVDTGLGYGVRPLPHVRVGVDYVFFWSQRLNMPFPTVTSGPSTDTIPGALGGANTTTIYQQHGQDPLISAGRAHATVWVPGCESISFYGNYFATNQGTQRTTTNSADYQNLTAVAISRPFFNPNSGVNEVFPISFPNLLSGVAVDVTQTKVTGWEANIRNTFSVRTTREPGFSITPMAGVRYVRIDESYFNNDRVVNLIDGNSNYFHDQFDATNTFFGGQVGLGFGVQMELLHLDFFGKFAMGNNRKTSSISGSSTVTDPITGIPFTDPTRGTYAQPTNIGSRTQTAFAYIPELGFNAEYSLTQQLKVTVGYTGFLLSDVIRPSGMIDQTVNPQALNGGAATGPLFPRQPSFDRQTMWIQMVQVGLELVY